jgi:hypothetical protein
MEPLTHSSELKEYWQSQKIEKNKIIPRRAINDNYLICYLCYSRFQNIYCSELKIFIRESTMCNSCKSVDYSALIGTTSLKKPVIDCNEISKKFTNYYVQTSLVELNPIIQKALKAPLDEVKRVFASCLREILQYDDVTLQKHCKSKSIEWNNWCADVVLYFICRKIIFGKEVPLIFNY